jgi:hypothetical protein
MLIDDCAFIHEATWKVDEQEYTGTHFIDFD